ncbi:MAG TPA: type II toxin-antitoxin system VapC family toxin, partial [Actinomycetota bacterium]|nr:type II toxin-antitoxin system VapC family toxin [Actinomycetota bacterium]
RRPPRRRPAVTLVVDASSVVAALVDGGPDGAWARDVLASEPLAAPHLMPVEVANVLRRAAQEGELTEDIASLAHADLLDLEVELFPYEPFAERIWELRRALTAYDAWYVALAEAIGAALVTLDRRLERAAGPRCGFRTPPRRPRR